MIGRAGDERFVRQLAAQAVEHAGLGDDDEGLGRGIFAVTDHFFGRANFIGQNADSMGAFGVGDDGCIRIFGTDAFDALAGELDVHVAIALPERHGAPGLFHDPRAEIFVGDKKNVPVGGDIFDDLHRVAARADDVRERFHSRRAVDVGHDVVVFVRVFLEIGGELFRRTGVAERATGIQVGNDHGFAGIHNFGGLAHEMDAAEGDDIGLGFRGAVSQAERIAHMVSQLLDLGDLVVVREDDGVAFFFETLDFVGQKHG